MQITYEDGGPSYHTNDYFPHLHFQASAALADENYDLMIDWGTAYQALEDVPTEAESIDGLVNKGAVSDIDELELGSSGRKY